MRKIIVIVNLSFLLTILLYAQKPEFNFLISDKSKIVTIVCDSTDYLVVNKSVKLLSTDIEMVSGKKPLIKNSFDNVSGNVIIVGSLLKSGIIQQLVKNGQIDTSKISGKWEIFSISIIENLSENFEKALVICGSDRRGTAFGIFSISELIGVTPWYWWADVKPELKKEISINIENCISSEPSVKYRGIFLNDEDFGLKPWAAKTFEPETGDIGPKTYSKIFELLLRLKANTIWPAMHGCTKAFYYYPENKLVADTFAIVVGSSHAEPMLRNNVDEWDKKLRGDYNYKTNKDGVYKYWEERAIESSNFENIYTVGMRGIHDSKMEGINTMEEKVMFLEQIFSDQREIIKNHINPDVELVPQAFIPYKEVLEIYDNGLNLPDDVTIVWPDDNYGYIRRLNTEKEKYRKGGSGVYYHASYWGRPHDYLWLGTTHPALIREEMTKAYNNKADKIWILNVGDIKSIEYNMDLFLSMAYNIDDFNKNGYEIGHLKNWIKNTIGENYVDEMYEVILKYYDLAFQRRPEFMGWSQTEPTRDIKNTEFNHFYYGDQAQQRIDAYNGIIAKTRYIYKNIDPDKKDAFYQLFYYPVVCAGLINKKFLCLEKAYLYANQNRSSANDYAQIAKNAYDSIVIETDFYNNQLSYGKWKYMMDMKPRNLPVFQKPLIPQWEIQENGIIGLSLEGFQQYKPYANVYGWHTLPEYTYGLNQKRFIDIFQTGVAENAWLANASEDWIMLSKTNGVLTNEFGKKQERIWITIDENKIPDKEKVKGEIEVKSGNQKYKIYVSLKSQNQIYQNNVWENSNGYISIIAENGKLENSENSWSLINGLGYAGKSIVSGFVENDTNILNNPFIEFNIDLPSEKDINITVIGIPVHPLNSNYSLRFAVALNNNKPEVLDYKTYGRSEEWKENVLSNNCIKTCIIDPENAGQHILRIYAIDPGVIIDRIIIDDGNLVPGYGLIPETRIMKNQVINEK